MFFKRFPLSSPLWSLLSYCSFHKKPDFLMNISDVPIFEHAVLNIESWPSQTYGFIFCDRCAKSTTIFHIKNVMLIPIFRVANFKMKQSTSLLGQEEAPFWFWTCTLRKRSLKVWVGICSTSIVCFYPTGKFCSSKVDLGSKSSHFFQTYRKLAVLVDLNVPKRGFLQKILKFC